MPSVDIRKFRDLGAVIKAVRESRSLRQDELSESLGFSRFYLRELESGKPNLFATRLFRVLNKLSIRITVTYDLRRNTSDDGRKGGGVDG